MTRVETGDMEIMSAKSRDPPFPPTATEPATAKATPQSARQPSPVVSRWPATWLRRHDHGRHDARRRPRKGIAVDEDPNHSGGRPALGTVMQPSARHRDRLPTNGLDGALGTLPAPTRNRH